MYASYLCCPEASEEELRVKKGKLRHRPDRFFIPLDQLSDEEPNTRPLYACELSRDGLETRMAVFFQLRPSNIFRVYDQAAKEGRFVIAELIAPVVRSLVVQHLLNHRARKAIRDAFKAPSATDPVAGDILAAVQ